MITSRTAERDNRTKIPVVLTDRSSTPKFASQVSPEMAVLPLPTPPGEKEYVPPWNSLTIRTCMHHTATRIAVAGEDMHHTATRIAVAGEDMHHTATRIAVAGEDMHHTATRIAVAGEGMHHTATRIEVAGEDMHHTATRIAVAGEDDRKRRSRKSESPKQTCVRTRKQSDTHLPAPCEDGEVHDECNGGRSCGEQQASEQDVEHKYERRKHVGLWNRGGERRYGVADHGRGHIDDDHGHDEVPVPRRLVGEPEHVVNDEPKQRRWKDAQWNEIAHEFCKEVGKSGVEPCRNNDSTPRGGGREGVMNIMATLQGEHHVEG